MLRAIAIVSLFFAATQILAQGASFFVESKEDAMNKRKSMSQTFNMSYPGGETNTTVTVTTVTMPTCPPCPTFTTDPLTTSSVNTTCAPQENGALLAYILTPIFAVVGFGAGIIVGACAMKKMRNSQ